MKKTMNYWKIEYQYFIYKKEKHQLWPAHEILLISLGEFYMDGRNVTLVHR